MPTFMEVASLRKLAVDFPIDALLITTQRGYDVRTIFEGMFLFIETLEILPLPEEFESGYWTEVQP